MAGYFDKQPSLFYLRAQFHRRVQHNGESVSQFVSALREMVALCDFARDIDERVRGQFIAYVSRLKMRERLLQEPNDRTLAASSHTGVDARKVDNVV